MNRSSFGFILIACIYSISINTVVGFGAICTIDANCTDNGEVCDTSNSTCACNTNDKYYYNGSQCDLDINECTASPNYCHTNADYANTPGSYACITGYSGNGITCTDIDECTANLHNCDNNADCTNTPRSFTCACKTGYSGNGITCTDIDECTASQDNCDNNADCTNTPGSFTCACKTGYSGNGIICTDIDECTASSDNCHIKADCKNTPGSFTCACKTGYSGNGVNCTDIDECTASDNCHINADCTNTPGSFTCACKTGYSGNGTTCTDIDECTANLHNCDNNADCKNMPGSFTCACKTGYSGNGITCTDIDECTASSDNCHINADCKNTPGSFTCACKTGYSGNGIICTDIDECTASSDNCHIKADCKNTPGSFTCACKTGYSGNGVNCTDIDDCYSNPCLNGGTCTDLVNDYNCTCKEGFSAKTCSVAALGAVCGQTGTTCQNTNAECRNECVCKSFYYDSDGTSNIGGTCLPSKILGKACGSLPNECKDSYAQCLDDKCTCGDRYYDSNGFPEGGSCNNISNLQVKEIIFPTNLVTTSGFTVKWKPPDGTLASFVNRYEIDWRLKTNPNGLSKEIASTETSLVINTGVTAGKTYTVTVTSKNTQTQNDIARTVFLSKEQAAKPNTPGAIDKGRSDLNASDGSITLYWLQSSGGVSGYKLTLSDGTNSEPYNPTSEYFTFSPEWLKNGFRYNVTIQAKSETFEGGKVVFGVEYREEIKTVVTEPTAPQSVACKEIFDESIILEWKSPSKPNGDLVRYTVNVYHSKQAYLFPKSTNGIAYTLKIEDLKPGTLYTFRVFTENEVYNSTTYGEKDCQTKAKLSDPPSNLTVTLITSRNFTVHWDKPNNTHSEENYGYVIQTKIGEQCFKEVVYRCIDCRDLFKPSLLENMCPNSLREVFNRTKDQLVGKQSLQFLSLLPDTMYTISATAVNSEGRGNVVKITQTTNEEVPQVPYSVAVSNITSTSFLVAWSIDGDRPGKTDFTVYVTADSPARNKEITVTGFSTRSKLVENLEEYWNYIVSVEATTSLGSRKSSPTSTQRTLPAAPGQVSDFQIIDAPGGNYTQMKVTWKAPEILQRNSIIKEYKFKYYYDENSMLSESRQHETSDIHEYIVFVDVRPEQKYTVQVFAVNEEDQNGEETTESISTPAGVPVNIETTLGVEIIPKQSVKNRGQTRFTVSITEEFFTESTYGDIRATGLVACAKQCDALDIKMLSDFNSMDNWQKARTSVYRVTEAKWRENLQAATTTGARRKRAVTEIEYTVGSDTCSNVGEDQYCNGPLQPDTSYMLFAVSCTNGGCLVSNQYGPFITLAEPEKSSLGMIVGIVVAVVVVLAVVSVIGFIMIRRRQRRPGGMKPAPNDDDEEFTGIDPAIAKIPRKRPVVLSEIEEYVTNMHKDSNLLFSSEYEDLKTLSPKHSCEAADKEENRMRNRYINIIPFDHSRVKLSTNGEDDSSDYINANYLPGYTSPREYIGCQGPIPGTIDDFWRMVWEQNVSVIVMLTLCKEGQKIKCEQYWPDEVGEPKQYGDVVVEINSYSNIRTYDYRMFKITSGNKTRVIKHFHFLSWLDFQANVHHDIILDFIQHVRQHVQPPDTSGPMIIHCSAGVGRTGTYIVLDHLIQFIYDHDFDVSIDIFDMVLKLRENRMHMVQTEQQYVFIHDCVNEIMNRKRRETDNIYVNQAFSSDENIYQNDENLYANVAKGSSEQNTEL